MLLKVVRENETTYYIPDQIRKITISPVYGHEEEYDVAFYLDSTMEIVKVCNSYVDAENCVRHIYQLMKNTSSDEIISLDDLK